MAFSQVAVAGWTGKPLMREASRASTWTRILSAVFLSTRLKQIGFRLSSGTTKRILQALPSFTTLATGCSFSAS